MFYLYIIDPPGEIGRGLGVIRRAVAVDNISQSITGMDSRYNWPLSGKFWMWICHIKYDNKETICSYFYSPTTSMSAATIDVSNVGASADTSQANLPDIEVGTLRNST